MSAIIVSACLLGVPCRWHGRAVSPSSVLRRFRLAHPDIRLIAVCPEEIGGLPTPRPPVKRRRGRVFETCAEKPNRRDVTGRDVTDAFRAGAAGTLAIARENGCHAAILCKWSPSCDLI